MAAHPTLHAVAFNPRSARQSPPPARQPAVFIDKDGMLLACTPEEVDPALLQFMSGVPESLAALARAGFALVLIHQQKSYQQSLGTLGCFNQTECRRLQASLTIRLRDEAGVKLTAWMVCPHVPDKDGPPECACRKPSPRLLQRAAVRFGLDLARSWMVGDTLDDVEAGRRAGCRSVLLDSGEQTMWRGSPLRRPTACCSEWDEVAHMVIADALSSV